MDVGSPFDYRRQGNPLRGQAPGRAREGSLGGAAGRAARAAGGLRRRSAGLFSSRRAAEDAAEALRGADRAAHPVPGDAWLPSLVRSSRTIRGQSVRHHQPVAGVDIPGTVLPAGGDRRDPFPSG
ncbi:hypothetical protein QJS66_06470 [Kocuria rhizophila]|nr:hypothetical protein QJS66_06470 [Kocuria rhizophila]